MKTLKVKLSPGVTVEQVNAALPYVSGIVKNVLGVANNVAQVALFNARDDLKRHPRFRQQAKQAVNAAIKAWDEYEKRLLNPVGLRYFHVEDMPPHIRKRYGNITDREFYEFWQNVGWSVYSKNRNFITTLDHKFLLSLQKHGVQHPKLLCRAMTAAALLEIAVQRYEDACKVVHKEIGLPTETIEEIYGCFSLKAVWLRWEKALTLLAPPFPLDELEEKNIKMSLEQLYEIICDIPEMYNGITKSTEDYAEVFRTKGMQKKILREIAEAKEEARNLIKNDARK